MAIRIDNNFVTFIAPAEAKFLIGDFTDWQDNPIAIKDQITLEFPKDSFIEYAFLDSNGKPFADPDNQIKTENPWWNYPRAAILSKYQSNPLKDQLPEIKNGKIESFSWESKVFPGHRRSYIYQPPIQQDKYQVFYVQDGVAYYRTGKLNTVLDNLIHLGSNSAILVFLEPKDRTKEYYLNDQYIDFLEEAMLQIENKYPIEKNSAKRGLIGASLGGLASLYAAFKRPDLFSKVLSQSGAFQAEPNTTKKRADEWLLTQFEGNQKLNLRIALDCGQFEWLLSSNRRMAAMLFDKGYEHRYFERPSGHNWTTWRNNLPESLEYLL